MDLVLFRLSRGFAIDWIVEVHALSAVPPPVAVYEVNAGAQDPEDHCGNDRNCMYLTYSREGHVNTWLTGGGMIEKTEKMTKLERDRIETNDSTREHMRSKGKLNRYKKMRDRKG